MTGFVEVLAQAEGEALLHDPLTGGDWIKAGVVMAAALVLAVAVSKIMRRVVTRGIGPGFPAILTSRFLGYAVFVLGLSYALTVLGVRVGPLLSAPSVSAAWCWRWPCRAWSATSCRR